MIGVTIGSAGYYYLNVSRAFFIATLVYEPIQVNQQEIVEIDLAQSDSLNRSILNTTDTVTVSLPATGEKETGEKAKGKIRIFNATSEIMVLKQGDIAECVISLCQGLQYQLSNDVNIGPQSPEEVGITAIRAGIEYNLKSGDGRFKVGGYSTETDIVATNIVQISGGTERKTEKTITAKDIKDATDLAKSTFDEKILEKLKNLPNTSSSFYFIQESLSTEITAIKPDRKEGDIANLVNVSVTGSGQIEVFDKTLIDKKAQDIFDDLTPIGYKESPLVFNTKDWKIIEESGRTIKIQTNAQISFIPDFDFNKIKTSIMGVEISKAPDKLKEVEFVIDVRTSYFPESYIPNFMKKVPDNFNKIELRIEAKKK